MIRIPKIDPRNLVLLLVSSSMAILMLEVLLRILFSTNQTFLIRESYDRAYLSDNAYWKVWHYPNNKVTHNKDCFSANYQTNQYGMRNKDIALHPNGKYRIALLGDSFVEGYGVSDQQVFSHLLDSLLGNDIEVLNFGSSGGFGTIHELALYDNFVRHFKPDLVLLFFLNYNDLYDNYNAQKEGLIDEELNLIYTKGTMDEVLSSIQENNTPEIIHPVISGLYVIKLAAKGWRVIGSNVQSLINMKSDFKQTLADVYSTKGSELTEVGYEITGKCLKELTKQVAKDSAQLMVIQLPDPYQTDKNWLAFTAMKYDKEMDPTLPNQKLKQICQHLDIPYYDMYPKTIDYIEQNDMGFPYFSYQCDRHLSPEGHDYIARELASYIKAYLALH